MVNPRYILYFSSLGVKLAVHSDCRVTDGEGTVAIKALSPPTTNPHPELDAFLGPRLQLPPSQDLATDGAVSLFLPGQQRPRSRKARV